MLHKSQRLKLQRVAMNLNEFIHYCSPFFTCTEEGLMQQAGSMSTPLLTPEIHHSNDFYGAASCIKRYLGLPPHYVLRAAMEHGIYYEDSWKVDIDAPLPALFFVSRHRYAYLPPLTNKFLYAIGPALAYVDSAISEENLVSLKKKLGKTLLVFPSHSTHWIHSSYDVVDYCHQLTHYRDYFDTIIILLYWKDIIQNLHKVYIHYGFPCLSAGHMYDFNFLPRLKSYILLADSTCCNKFTTGSSYCLYLNKPHFCIPMKIHNTNTLKNHGILNDGESGIEQQFNKIFSCNKCAIFSITKEQEAFGNNYMGLKDTKTPQEMLDILRLMEVLYPYYQTQKNNPNFCFDAVDILKKRGYYYLATLALEQINIMSYNKVISY